MSFISIEFILLFAIFIPVYFHLKLSWQIVLILLVSYLFYAFSRVEYVFLLALTTVIDFLAALGLSRIAPSAVAKRRGVLAISLASNLGILFLFKYYNFFNLSLRLFFNNIGVPYQPLLLELALPIGISFYTFQSMAYTIDVYRNKVEAETNFLRFAAYVAFFPQLVAGPIERAAHLFPQFRIQHQFDYARAVSGFQLILWGAFKKVVIADRLAIYVNEVFNGVQEYRGFSLLLATLFFTFQIYCDFSGYSDIAIGVARVIGFDLMENFRQPYFAQSVREFWQRWHISLSTWFRDYLYIPLGGNRVSFPRTLLNLMLVFLASGLWHGASWTFVIWGSLHGLCVVLESIFERFVKLSTPPSSWQIGLKGLFSFILVAFAWIFFRANSIEDAGYVISHLLDFSQGFNKITRPFGAGFLDSRLEFLIAFGLIALLLFADWWKMQKGQLLVAACKWRSLRWLGYYVLALVVIVTYILYSSTAPAFIYFQF